MSNQSGDRVTRIAILGSTGSIGCSALSVAAAHPERIDVVCLAAGHNVDRFVRQVEQHRPSVIALADDDGLAAVRSRLGLSGAGGGVTSWSGAGGLLEVATHPDVDVVLCATTGTTALDAVFAAIEEGKTIALANKSWMPRGAEEFRSCRSTASTTPSTSVCTAAHWQR